MKYWLILLILFTSASTGQGFDHSHSAYSDVLQRFVIVYDGGMKSVVNYRKLAGNPKSLNNYLTQLSEISSADYKQWSESEQLAFLINAYNAFTLKLIIDHIDMFESGDAKSIRDLGGFFSSPWEKSFFKLLGEKRSLDWLEHEKIRVDFNEPRIHAALVCAAMSCPKLRSEAYIASELDAQLEEQMNTFLSDNDKNGIDTSGVYLSKIFDWYGEDFNNLKNYLRGYSKALADSQTERETLQGDFSIRYLNYDWSLNSPENR
ncbi:MAG: DUF547 domain-containing protein [Idiomarina sp.]|uniref:DUF547 domain-containing protein n=1 Tax=Idiomarina sp. TaxID=1874361 RepID=UPI001D63BDD1|nr:DUF547 domain-containing protein [Idiomarina sp.]NQZ17426.1 DUF547 domain-containing protein [Idiomarina sp.]